MVITEARSPRGKKTRSSKSTRNYPLEDIDRETMFHPVGNEKLAHDLVPLELSERSQETKALHKILIALSSAAERGGEEVGDGEESVDAVGLSTETVSP